MAYELADIHLLINSKKESYRKSARLWKCSYRGLLILSALLSAAAAVLASLSLEPSTWRIAGAICAGLAGVCTTAIASLEFEKNWLINKRAKHQADLLLLDIAKGETDINKLVNGLKGVVQERLERSSED